MQVWGIRIQNSDGRAIDLWQALLRFLIAIVSLLCLGMGYWWMLIDKQKRTRHDIYSESQAVQLPKTSTRSNRSARATRPAGRAPSTGRRRHARRRYLSRRASATVAPISAQTQAGNTTANSGEKPNT